jgi:riboflavin kinase/FMN adenylyltransferase
MVIINLPWNQSAPSGCRGGALTIGNFDGVHRGHATLLEELCRQARMVHGPAAVLTFDPHPLQLLRPESFLPMLTTMADRVELLQSHGADHVIVLQTTPQLLALKAEQFFEQVIRQLLPPRVVVEGPNFGFGRNREGTVADLRQWCAAAGWDLVVVTPMQIDGQTVSSSRVRNALSQGAIETATRLLGRCYRLHGVVGKGQHRGQALGFPTANLDKVQTVVPGNGVYAVRVLHGGTAWAGAANIGPNPTFGEAVRKVEVHLIDFQGDLYGQSLTVDFVARLRDTRRFGSATELTNQLRHDIDQARRLASNEGPAGSRH